MLRHGQAATGGGLVRVDVEHGQCVLECPVGEKHRLHGREIERLSKTCSSQGAGILGGEANKHLAKEQHGQAHRDLAYLGYRIDDCGQLCNEGRVSPLDI